MLHEFLTANRDELIARCRSKVAKRPVPPPTAAEVTHGIPLFLSQITETLRRDAASDESGSRRISGPIDPGTTPTATEIGKGAALHGDELQRKGFTIDQVVHDYGDLCQAITELAVEQEAPIAAREFRTLNRCLDNDQCGGFPSGDPETMFRPFAQRSRDRSGLGLSSANGASRPTAANCTCATGRVRAASLRSICPDAPRCSVFPRQHPLGGG